MSAALSCDGCAAQWIIKSKRCSRKSAMIAARSRMSAFAVRKVPGRIFEPLKVPQGVAGRTKEFPPHIVIHPDHAMALQIEIRDRFGANQPTATGD